MIEDKRVLKNKFSMNYALHNTSDWLNKLCKKWVHKYDMKLK